jgi:glutamyl-tRNA synthetase
MTKPFFSDTIEYQPEATTQLQQPGSATVLEAILAILAQGQELTEASAQDIIKQVMKAQNLKKGVVMKALRSAISGEVHGPDLIQSWLLLHQLGLDQPRIQNAISH